MFRDLGIAVLDSDAVVHDLYSLNGAAVPIVEASFPGVVVDGAISRPLLSTKVVGKSDALRLLESIVHPLVQAEKQRFVMAQAEQGATLVVLDIPLLFETGAEAECDAVAVVSAPADVQRERVLARPGMSAEKLDGILLRQMPDEEKRKKADFVIDTSVSLEETQQHVAVLVDALKGRQGKAYALIVENS